MNFFKKICFFLLSLFLIIYFNNIFSACVIAAEKKKSQSENDYIAQGLKIGYVDMAALLAFHPMMQYYSYDANIFIRPLKGGLTKSEFLKQIRERQDKYKILKENTEADMKRLQFEIDSIEAEINKLRVKVSREQAVANQKYSDDYTKISDEAVRKQRTSEYHAQLFKLDRDYYDEKKKLDEQKEKKYVSMNAVILRISEVDYLNDVDSKNFFNSILDEIDAAIKETAEEKKVPFILNSNYISMFTPKEQITINNNFDVPASAIRTNIPPMANYSYLLDNIDGPEETMAENEITSKKEFVKNECTRLLNRRAEIARLFSRYRVLNKMVVYGGVDLTSNVLEKLLKKHSVSNFKIPVILETLDELLSSRIDFNEPQLGNPHQ